MKTDSPGTAGPDELEDRKSCIDFFISCIEEAKKHFPVGVVGGAFYILCWEEIWQKDFSDTEEPHWYNENIPKILKKSPVLDKPEENEFKTS